MCDPWMTCLYYDLSFDRQKPSHVTNIHRKFHDFFPSGLGVIKVLHFTITVRSEDSVRVKQLIRTYFCIAITFHALLHSFSFIYLFIHSFETFIHKFLIKRGALIGLNLALLEIGDPKVAFHVSYHESELTILSTSRRVVWTMKLGV